MLSIRVVSHDEIENLILDYVRKEAELAPNVEISLKICYEANEVSAAATLTTYELSGGCKDCGDICWENGRLACAESCTNPAIHED